MNHDELRARDLLFHGGHYDYEQPVLQGQPIRICLDPTRLSREDGWTGGTLPRRLVLWVGAGKFGRGKWLAGELGLRPSEVVILTGPTGARGMKRPVYLRLPGWDEDPHATEIGHFLKVAQGLDLTDLPGLLDLVVAHILGLRDAVKRNEQGAR